MANLQNQYIDESFQKLLQLDGGVLQNGTGSLITTLDVTASIAISASYASTASFALNVTDPTWDEVQNKPAGLVSGSSQIDLSQATGTAASAVSASHSLNADNSVSSSYAASATSSSFATTASYALNANVNSGSWDGQYTGSAGIQGRLSINGTQEGVVQETLEVIASTGTVTAMQLLVTGSGPKIAFQGAHVTNGFPNATLGFQFDATDVNAVKPQIYFDDNGNGSDIISEGDLNITSSLGVINIVSPLNAASITGSLQGNADTATSASYATNALTASKVTDTNIAYKNQNNTFTGTQTFDTITATSASFGHVQTVTGSAVIIGEQYIILNADSPTARFAGVQVYDSGSLTTGSFEWDSVDDNWIQVKTDGTSGGMLTGVHGTKGAEAYPANNKLTKGTGTESITESSITDNGTRVTTPIGITAGNSVTSTVGGIYASIYGGEGGFVEVVDTTGNNLGFGLNPSLYGTSGWTGPGIWGNDTGGNYPVLIGFQDTSNWTDGRVTFLTPVSASSGIIGNLTGNASTATTASFALTSADSGNWDGQYTGSAGIQGTLGMKDLSAIPATVFSVGGPITNYFQVENEALQAITGKGVVLAGGLQIDGGFTAVNGNNDISGSLTVTGGITGDLTGNATTATSASYALTASHALNAGEWNGQYSGSAGITGSLFINGVLTTNYGTTAANTEKDIATWSPVQDQNGNTFNLAHNLLTNYTGYGPAYRGAFGIEYWDSYGYNYGNEFYVSPTRTQYYLKSPSGRTGQDNFRWVEDSANEFYNQTQKYIQADHIFFQANSDRGGAINFLYTNPSGSAAASSSFASFDMGQNYGDSTRTSYSVQANDIAFGNFGPNSGDTIIRFGGDHSDQIYFNVSGSIINLDKAFGVTIDTTNTQEILLNTENAIKVSGSLNHYHGNAYSHVDAITVVGAGTSTMDCSTGNMFTIALNASTTLTATNIVGGQTISVRVVNGGANTLAFDTMFEFAGGTAPTITSSGTDVITFISFDGTTLYSTAVQNLS